MKRLKISHIIHIFALLHAAVAFLCCMGGVDDSLLLTALTMSMAVIICLKKDTGTSLIAADLILVNAIGFIFGTYGARLLLNFIGSDVLVRVLSTIMTTEILGWGSSLFLNIMNRDRKKEKSLSWDDPKLRWVIGLLTVVFVLRFGLGLAFSSSQFADTNVMEIVWSFISNSAVLIFMICINLIYVRYISKRDSISGLKSWLMMGLMITSVAALSSLIVNISDGVRMREYFQGFIVGILIEITVYCLVLIVDITIAAQKAVKEEMERASAAQFRYIKLKQQMNPHFLFNSLNSLDNLVCEQKTEQASTYIHKLAGIYRYFLKNEDETLVTLKEEINFAMEYRDLMKVRFPEGFEIKFDIEDQALGKLVLPSAVQLLVENAIKHNAVTAKDPLIISVKTEKEKIIIENNLLPKLTKSLSMKLGQKYIREYYKNIYDRDIEIVKTDKIYRVILPLL